MGATLLVSEAEGDDDAEEPPPSNDTRPLPNRAIYCIDLRAATDVQPFVNEVRRIVAEASVKTVDLVSLAPMPAVNSAPAVAPARIDEEPARRWYPVIDYSRCTNCLECIDFCLFGVYGIDAADKILVEQPDNCRKGCPACSRVCPANAIIFPQHKSPAIAGSADGEAGGLKIDLSKLFGAPDALQAAVLERDVELVAVGRDAVGMGVGIPKRQTEPSSAAKDDLDRLIDQLDALDL
jgi:hypothetical protein